MLGIVWGIVAVTVLIAYGSGFRACSCAAFDAFGKSAVVGWPGQTSEQAGGERAGRRIRFEQADLDAVRARHLVKQVSLETVSWLPISYGDRLANTAVRGVVPGVRRDPQRGRRTRGGGSRAEDFVERRRVVFLGDALRQKLFGGRPAVGETIAHPGRALHGRRRRWSKMQFSNYFTSDDESVSSRTRPPATVEHALRERARLLAGGAVGSRRQAIEQVRAAIGKRQRFSATDKRAIQMFGREEFRPIIDGLTIGLQVLLLFIGMLTLGIGGVGVMNIMLVSVDERIREIGLRRALGASAATSALQFLAEALVLTLVGGVFGILLST